MGGLRDTVGKTWRLQIAKKGQKLIGLSGGKRKFQCRVRLQLEFKGLF